MASPEPSPTSKPKFDRNALLRGWGNAKAALRHPDLSPEEKALLKKARDHAEVALGLHAVAGPEVLALLEADQESPKPTS